MAILPVFLHANRSLDRIAGATREEVIRTATDLARVPWVRVGLWKAQPGDVRVLGRFDIIGPDHTTPWPSVLVELRRRPAHSGQADRRALIAVYFGPAGEWAVTERESDKIPWGQFRGDREGQPSVLNGDDPRLCPDQPPQA